MYFDSDRQVTDIINSLGWIFECICDDVEPLIETIRQIAFLNQEIMMYINSIDNGLFRTDLYKQVVSNAGLNVNPFAVGG